MPLLEEACRFLEEWERKSREPLRLSVNVSRMTMLQPDFVADCRRIKDRYGIRDGGIRLELTESILVENHQMFRAIVEELRENGFSCSMDDFGAEQSSLHVLKDVPMDELKLDGRFFGEGEEERTEAVVNCILRLAEALHMETVAEGILEQGIGGGASKAGL